MCIKSLAFSVVFFFFSVFSEVCFNTSLECCLSCAFTQTAPLILLHLQFKIKGENSRWLLGKDHKSPLLGGLLRNNDLRFEVEGEICFTGKNKWNFNSLYSNIAEEWDFSSESLLDSKNAYHLCFLSLDERKWCLDVEVQLMLEVWVALSVLFMHNSVMFSDSSKGPQTAVSWNLGLLRCPWAFQKL